MLETTVLQATTAPQIALLGTPAQTLAIKGNVSGDTTAQQEQRKLLFVPRGTTAILHQTLRCAQPDIYVKAAP